MIDLFSTCPYVTALLSASHSVCLSVSVSVCLSLPLSLCFSVCLCLSVCLSLSVSVSLSLSRTPYMQIHGKVKSRKADWSFSAFSSLEKIYVTVYSLLHCLFQLHISTYRIHTYKNGIKTLSKDLFDGNCFH